MARVKLRCIMECPGLKNSNLEKALLKKILVKILGFWQQTYCENFYYLQLQEPPIEILLNFVKGCKFFW